MRKEIICTVCPRGCRINVNGDEHSIEAVTGYCCKRGEQYAISEFSHPVRILTTTVRILGNDHNLLPVRSSAPVPKELLFNCMEQIRTISVSAPIKRHEVIIPNICDTGVDIVSTKDLL